MFLGLASDLRNGQIKPLQQLDEHWLLTKDNSQCYLLSNICPHQNSLLTDKTVNGILECPYHGLQFDNTGNGLGNSYCLNKKELFAVGNMLFNQRVTFDFPADLSFMELQDIRIDQVNTEIDIFMDVFLDINHIPVVHPGVYDQISITDVSKIKYNLYDNASVQYVVADNSDHIIEQDRQIGYGALWAAVYPYTTIEWQPGALFVNVAKLNCFTGIDVVIYKYRDTRYTNQAWQLNNATWEQAWDQDKNLCEKIVQLPKYNLDNLKEHHRQWLNKHAF